MELTAWDVGQIRIFQMRRWKERFPALGANSLQHIGISDNCLHLHCDTDQVVGEAIAYGEELCRESAVILAVEHVSLWFQSELIWGAEARPFFEGVELADTVLDPAMTTATLERPKTSTTANTKAQNLNKRLPGQNLAAIASDLEIGVDELRTWLESNGAVIIPYGNDEVVTGEMAIMAYQQFEKTRLQRVMQRRGLLVEDSNFSQNGSSATAIATPPTEAPTKPARKTSTRKPAAKAKGTRAKKSTNV